jgi:3-oxoacyl-[acyl-carrier-protein] synthase I
MTGRPLAEILGLGLATPVGLKAGAAAAAIRAGITRVRESPLRDRGREPLKAGFLEEAYLPSLAPALQVSLEKVTARHRRMVRLASRALQEVAGYGAPRLPLLLALPEVYPWGDSIGTGFLEHLMEQSGVALDLRHSHVLRSGRAGGLLAVEHALKLLAMRQASAVLVGGVDTYQDARLLAVLESEGRLHVGELPDGLVPGEGAAFLLLASPGACQHGRQEPFAHILGTGSARELGHRYSSEPYLGEGLAQALHQLFERIQSPRPQVRGVYAGLNGERFWAKEWGVAYLRHAKYFAAEHKVEHPIEYIGDPGAALGPLMVALAAIGMKKGYRQGPCLVWCSSDREERAAVLLQSATCQ